MSLRAETADQAGSSSLERFHIAVLQCLEVRLDLVEWPVPPGDIEKLRNHRVRIPHPDDRRGVAANHGVRRYVARDHGTRRYDRARTDCHPRHDRRLMADPDVMRDHRIPDWQVLVAEGLGPEDPEGIRREARHWMVGGTGDEVAPPRDLHELADNQPLPACGPEVRRKHGGRILGLSGMCKIAVVADLHAGMVDDIFQMDGVAIKPPIRQRDRMRGCGVEKWHERRRLVRGQIVQC